MKLLGVSDSKSPMCTGLPTVEHKSAVFRAATRGAKMYVR
jgi:hypothetical protein